MEIPVLPTGIDVVFVDGALAGDLTIDVRPLLNHALAKNPSARVVLQNQRRGLFFLKKWAHEENRGIYIPPVIYGLELRDFSAALILDDGSGLADSTIKWCSDARKPVYRISVTCTPFQGEFVELPCFCNSSTAPSLAQRIKNRISSRNA